MISSRLSVRLFGLTSLCAIQALATPILYYSTTAPVSTGLGHGATAFTTAVTNAFGAANVRETANFADTATFADASALFINLRDPSAALAGQELTNIQNFINAGGAVFFVGDHLGWQTWDNSFLGIFGDSASNWIGATQAAKATPAGISLHLLPSLGNQINVDNPGAILNGHGTSLFEGLVPMSELYGPAGNAIAFLDSSALNNNAGRDFYEGVASWLLTTGGNYDAIRTQGSGASVPDNDVGTLPLLAVALCAVFRLRRR